MLPLIIIFIFASTNSKHMNDYKPRVADSRLTDLLDAMGAVLIEGPKYCGKTTLAEQHSGSILYMADPETREQNIISAGFFKGLHRGS